MATTKTRQAWDVKVPPAKKRILAGKLVSTVRGSVGFAKQYKLVLELKGPSGLAASGDALASPTAASNETVFAKLSAKNHALEADDQIVIRLLKAKRSWGFSKREESDSSDDEDDASVAHSEVADDEFHPNDYKVYRCYPLETLLAETEEYDADQAEYETQCGAGKHVEVRSFHFANRHDLVVFSKALQAARKLLAHRSLLKTEEFEVVLDSNTKQSIVSPTTTTVATTSDAPVSVARSTGGGMDEWKNKLFGNGNEDVEAPTTNGRVQLLLEIVSATDLPPADANKSSDPYVVVYCGADEVHRTQYIRKNLNPVWTVDTGSLFCVDMSRADFFASPGLTFKVKDYDAVSKNDTMCTLVLKHDDLLPPNEEEENIGKRVEYELHNELKSFDPKNAIHPPKLNMRIRPAKENDLSFLQVLKDKQGDSGIYADAAFCAPMPHKVTRFKRETKTTPSGPLHRVKPGPDPNRPEQATKWLSRKSMQSEHCKPSTSWIEAGSGNLGRIYVEILRCHDLPNKDKIAGATVAGDVTDAFCTLLYEDAIVNTDVINDELSPLWMPWTQRAFCLHMNHPSSQLLLGVFDYDSGSNHDEIGRISVDVTNFSPGVEYVLSYTLFRSVLDEVRPPLGTITLRLRIVLDDPRKTLLASLGPPPSNFVNLAKMNDFHSAKFVIKGEEDNYRLDMDALKSYGKELESYQYVLTYVQQGLMTLLLWRGTFPVYCKCCQVKLPLYSVAAFLMGIFLVEDADLFFSCCLFSLGLLFLATNEQRQRHPSPWEQTHSFGGLWWALVSGEMTPKEIDLEHDDSELKPLIAKYNASEEARREKFDQDRKLGQEHLMSLNQKFAAHERAAAEDAAEDENMETKTSSAISLNPLKPILLPIQQMLGLFCASLRVVRSILNWDESWYAFIITNVCFVGGCVLLLIPWSWLIQWALRITVWTLLGPWMKLVDIFVVRKLEADGNNLAKRLESSMEQRSTALLVLKRAVMTRKEEAAKVKALKRYMFGEYVVQVPRFKSYRYPDIPLSESTAKVYVGSTSSIPITKVKYGQQLVGHMIPTWGDDLDGSILAKVSQVRQQTDKKASSRSFFGGTNSSKGASKASPFKKFFS